MTVELENLFAEEGWAFEVVLQRGMVMDGAEDVWGSGG